MVRQAEVTPPRRPGEGRCAPRWLTMAALAASLYLLSSGPVLATAFWLRDATRQNAFYAVMWLYAPLLYLGDDGPIGDYIEWWVNLFDAAGPG